MKDYSEEILRLVITVVNPFTSVTEMEALVLYEIEKNSIRTDMIYVNIGRTDKPGWRDKVSVYDYECQLFEKDILEVEDILYYYDNMEDEFGWNTIDRKTKLKAIERIAEIRTKPVSDDVLLWLRLQ